MEYKKEVESGKYLGKWFSNIRNGNKKTILITLLVLSAIAYILFSIKIINHKNKFEDSYNSEFYFGFTLDFYSEDSAFERYIGVLDKAVNSRPLNSDEISLITGHGRDLGYQQNTLVNFYLNHYKRDERLFNLNFFYSFLRPMWLDEKSFTQINKDQYVIKDEALKRLNNYYIGPKVQRLEGIFKEFKSQNMKYFDDIYNNRGRRFVKDGRWIELFYNMNKALEQVEWDYDFGVNAPRIPELREFDDWCAPKEVQNVLMKDVLKSFPGNYSVIDTKSGIYFYFSTSGQRKIFEVKSFNVSGNKIEIIVDEGDNTSENSSGSCVYNTLLIRGIKPGDSKNYEFHVINTHGEEFNRI